MDEREPLCRSSAGASDGQPPGAVQLRIPSDPRYLGLIRDVVARVARCLGFDDECCWQLQLALDESVTNVIRHGYDDRRDCPIDITMEPVSEGRQALHIRIIDAGKMFDPASLPKPDLEHTDELVPGGLGVHIIHTLMDEVRYTPRPEGGMELRLTKFLKEPG